MLNSLSIEGNECIGKNFVKEPFEDAFEWRIKLQIDIEVYCGSLAVVRGNFTNQHPDPKHVPILTSLGNKIDLPSFLLWSSVSMLKIHI